MCKTEQAETEKSTFSNLWFLKQSRRLILESFVVATEIHGFQHI